MAEKLIQFGLIGCGRVAQMCHLPSISMLKEAKLKAVCDIRESVSKTIGQTYHVPHFTDFREMIGEAYPDAVSVCTHEDSHVPIAIEALKRGINVICEKPISNSVTQAERLVQVEKNSNAKVMIAYMQRYDPGVRFVEDLLANEEIGRPYVASLTWFISDHIPKGGKSVFDRELGNVCPRYLSSEEKVSSEFGTAEDAIPQYYILGYGCHLINLLRGFLGEVKEVISAYINPEKRDTFVILRHMRGCFSSIVMTDGQRDDWKELLQIQCDKGAVELEIPFLYKRGSASVRVHKGDGTYSPSLPYTYRYAEEYKDFISCLRSGRPFKTGASDGLQDLKIIREIIDLGSVRA